MDMIWGEKAKKHQITNKQAWHASAKEGVITYYCFQYKFNLCDVCLMQPSYIHLSKIKPFSLL